MVLRSQIRWLSHARPDPQRRAHLFSRNNKDWTPKLKHIAAAVQTLPIQEGWLDGEIVVMDVNHQPSFNALQNAFDNRSSQIQMFFFDVPFLNGYDLRDVRLDERRALLALDMKGATSPLHFSKRLQGDPATLFKSACELQMEGLIGKSVKSHYHAGRSRDWIKLKCITRQEFVIGGYTDSKRPSPNSFGALLIGVYEEDGTLRYTGSVGTGFSDAMLSNIMGKLRPLTSAEMPFATVPGSTKGVHWVKPKLVAEVAYVEMTPSGQVRHASFQGLRLDKPARSVRLEKAVSL